MIKVLVITSLDSEQNNPYFRLGAIQKTIVPIVDQLIRGNSFDCKYLLSEHIYDELIKSRIIEESQAIVVHQTKEDDKFINKSIFAESYITTKNDEEIKAFLREKTADFCPDIVLVWETASEVIRKAFDHALVIDLMPGFMSRPPYPKMISLDPAGIYKNCWYKDFQGKATKEELLLKKELQAYFKDFFDHLNAEDFIRNIYKLEKETPFSLIPLQITDYFGFKYNCDYKNQYDFLNQTLSNGKGKIFVATQYTGKFVSENILTKENIEYLNKYTESCVKYQEELNEIDSISQSIVPYCEEIYSISSTLGLQAALFDKKIVSESNSHLKFLNDPTIALNIISIIISRGQFFFEKAVEDKDYFKNILLDIYKKFKENKKNSDLLPSNNTLQTNYANYLNYAKPRPAARSFKKVFPINEKELEILPTFKKSIESSQVRIVSFDVFDTLLRRDVGEPKDIFYIVKEVISANYPHLPSEFINNFVSLRQTSERMLRDELDKKIELKETEVEEFSIFDVYNRIQEISGINIPVGEFVKIEEDVELGALYPRRLGNFLFEFALSKHKKVIVISDFIHSEEFVKKALKQNGFEPNSVYVSSKYSLKKHSGNLFKKVIELEKVRPEEILHIGDNIIGDIKQPRSLGIRSIKLTSNLEYIKESFKACKKDLNLLKFSAYYRQIWSMYAERYFQCYLPQNYQEKFISRPEELGYIYLGPTMFAFADSIIRKAESAGINQILFFARDCWLPFIAAEKIIKSQNKNIKVAYLQISRKSSTGIDLYKPADIFKVRIDDFSKDKTFRDLLSARFLLEEKDIPNVDSLNKDILSKKLRDITLAETYSNLYSIIQECWTVLNERYSTRRILYKQLIETNGINTNHPVIGIDLGYKGSIHKKIQSLFKGGLTAYLFMTYTDGYGKDPIKNVNTFFSSNLIPVDKQLSFLSHNLLFESLVNQSVGTALNIIKNSKSQIEVVLDNSLQFDHRLTIDKIHNGASQFFDDYLKVRNKFEYEKSIFSILFGELVKKPTLNEVNILQNLVFDNSFAGSANVPFVSLDKNIQQKSKYLWPEGNRLLSKYSLNNGLKIKNKSKEEPSIKIKTQAKKGLIYKIIEFGVKRTSNERKYNKFVRDPKNYFLDSSNSLIKQLSKLY